MKIISFIQAKKFVRRGCLCFLVHPLDVSVESTSIEQVPMVLNF